MDISPEKSTTQKQGTIKKCPACGAALGAFVSSCASCGHELSDIEANRSITALVSKFEDIEKNVEEKGLMLRSREKAIVEKKARVIRDFPIPNSREDLQQLLYFIQPKITDSVKPDPNQEDWRAKFSEVLNRARNAYKDDSAALAEFDRIEKSLNTTVTGSLQIRAKRYPLVVGLIVIVIALAVFGFISSRNESTKLVQCDEKYAQGSQAEKTRLEKVFATVETEFKDKKYPDALSHTSQIRWEYDEPCKAADIQKMKLLWDEKRNTMVSMIEKSKESADAGVKAEADRVSLEKQAEQRKIVDLANLKNEKEKAKTDKVEADLQKVAKEKTW